MTQIGGNGGVRAGSSFFIQKTRLGAAVPANNMRGAGAARGAVLEKQLINFMQPYLQGFCCL